MKLSAVIILLLPVFAFGQSCPRADSTEAAQSSVLHGSILYHNELRQWIGLKLASPVCGKPELQLVYADPDAYRRAKSLRGCTVTATGKIYEGLTGYYSASLAIENPEITPDASCHPKPVEADPSKAEVPAALKGWRATIMINYRSKGHIEVKVHQIDDSSSLQPWQAYVHYSLNGGADVIWFGCRTGFQTTDISVSPSSELIALNDGKGTKGTGLQNTKGLNTVSFRCSRN